MEYICVQYQKPISIMTIDNSEFTKLLMDTRVNYETSNLCVQRTKPRLATNVTDFESLVQFVNTRTGIFESARTATSVRRSHSIRWSFVACEISQVILQTSKAIFQTSREILETSVSFRQLSRENIPHLPLRFRAPTRGPFPAPMASRVVSWMFSRGRAQYQNNFPLRYYWED